MSLKKTPDFLQNIFRKGMSSGIHRSYRFKTFSLDVEDRQLLNNGVPVALTPKVFDVLVFLVERAGHLVEKEELMRSIWADSFVEDANLSRSIHTLRKALGEDNDGNKFITTVAKKGYRFVADVTSASEPSPTPDTERDDDDLAADVWPGEIGSVAIEDADRQAVPEKVPGHPRYLFIGLTVLLFVSLGSFFAFKMANAETNGNGGPVSIVILPFRPIDTSDRRTSTDIFFAASLISQLSQAKNLKVRQLNAIRNYTDVTQNAVSIGKEQKAEYVLESNYLTDGGRLRVTSELLNVASNSVVATFRHDADNVDLFAAADDIVNKIGLEVLASLKFAPVPHMPNRTTVSELASEHYIHGVNLTNKRVRGDSDKAILEFENAISIDPKFADAYVGLAYAHETSYINGGDKAEHCSKGLAAVKRALELAPDLADAYTILGMNTLSCQGNRADSDAMHRRALELGPNSAFVRRFYGIYLTGMGKGDESVAELKVARDLDPNLPWTEKLLGRALFFARRYDEAIEQLIKTRELDKNDDEQVLYLFKSHEIKGDTDKAFEWFLVYESIRTAARSNNASERNATEGAIEAIKTAGDSEIASLKAVYARSGWPGVLQTRLEFAEKREKEGQGNFGEIASLAAQVGEKEKAFAYLEKALPKGQLFMAQILVEPTLDALRPDPRFDSIIARNWTN